MHAVTANADGAEGNADSTTVGMTPLLLPGNMCDARLWHGGARCLDHALVSAGMGRAVDADLTLDDTIEAMARRALLDTAGKLLPIGFSLGAIVAVEMWCLAPERIAGLVLLGYNATADLPARARLRPAQQDDVRAGNLERVLVEELKPNYLGTLGRGDPVLLSLLRDMGLQIGAEAFVRQSEALRTRLDRRDRLSSIHVPVLLGCGGDDILCPPLWHRQWAATIDDSTLFTVAGAGHMLPLEAPTTLSRTLATWFSTKEFR